jgi:hypothetical protein
MGSTTALPVPGARKPYQVSKKRMEARSKRELIGPHKRKVRPAGAPSGSGLSLPEWKKVNSLAMLRFFFKFNVTENDISEIFPTADADQLKATTSRLYDVVDKVQRDMLMNPHVSKPVSISVSHVSKH